jgi:hypothetical protein
LPHGAPKILISLVLKLGFRRGKVAALHFTLEANGLMRTIAEGFVRGMAAATQGHPRATPQAEAVSLGVQNLKVPFDAERAVVERDDLGGHGFSS